MSVADRTGLLLINLGTPDSPEPRDVRPYLREFLSDPRVLDVAAWKRKLVLELFILPRRPRESGEAYATIWTEAGSPLLDYSRRLADKVRERLDPSVTVELAMRYGRPSIPQALERLRGAAVDRIVVFPLYPQYSSAATGSSLEAVMRHAASMWNVPSLQAIPAFYDHPAFLEAFERVARPYVEREPFDRVFFSFHGLPQRHVRKSDDSGRHCLEREDCCDAIVPANRNCYRAQCVTTARLLADRLAIPADKRVLCFQSRLGRDPWLSPYTDVVLEEHARAGARRALILSPAFVADCLETLEELAIRGQETWQEHGGETLTLVPSLNDEEVWVDALLAIAREHTTWLDPRAAIASGGTADGGHGPDTTRLA